MPMPVAGCQCQLSVQDTEAQRSRVPPLSQTDTDHGQLTLITGN